MGVVRWGGGHTMVCVSLGPHRHVCTFFGPLSLHIVIELEGLFVFFKSVRLDEF